MSLEPPRDTEWRVSSHRDPMRSEITIEVSDLRLPSNVRVYLFESGALRRITDQQLAEAQDPHVTLRMASNITRAEIRKLIDAGRLNWNPRLACYEWDDLAALQLARWQERTP